MGRAIGSHTEHDTSTFIGFLAQRREDLRLTQAEVAQRMGLRASAAVMICSYERGRVTPSLSAAIRWADVLDVDVILKPRER